MILYFTYALNTYKEDRSFYLPLQTHRTMQLQIVNKIFANNIECNRNVLLNSYRFLNF